MPDGSTVLSIESQSQRFATFFVAPLVGWSIDHVATQGLPGSFWPIGLVGAMAAFAILCSSGSENKQAVQLAK